ncbi:hypothetical protein LCGC14_1890970, partial [marine sediment metagenome]
MSNGQGQDQKSVFEKDTTIQDQEESVFEKDTVSQVSQAPQVSQVSGVPEIPFSEELEALGTLDPEILKTISQAQATFAPEATFAFSGALMAPMRNILVRPGEITLDDVFSGELPPLMSLASSELGIGPSAAILAKSGIVPGVIRGAMNMTKALAARPMETVLGLITAPAVITYQGLRGFINDTALPNITVAGNEDALELVRDRLVNIVGEMSPEEQEEANRAFAGLLASIAVGGTLFKTLGRPSFQFARQIGADKATALKQAKLIRAKVTGVTSLGVFGAVAGESTEKEKNFVMFALAAIPLGLTFHAFKSIGARTPKITDGPGRAEAYQGQRAARPFNQETTPVPEVKVEPIVRDRPTEIPLGEEVRPQRRAPFRAGEVRRVEPPKAEPIPEAPTEVPIEAPTGTTKLYRVESPEVLFEDVAGEG